MRRALTLLALTLATYAATAQHPLTYPHLVIFGDNYSDTLNTYNATKTTTSGYDSSGNYVTLFDAYPSAPYGYADGIFTNGYYTSGGSTTYYNGVWHQQLNTLLPGVPFAAPTINSGQPTTSSTNYAWGSATTGSGTTTVTFAGHFTVAVHNLNQQIDDYLNSGHVPDSRSLYVLFGGLNDLLNDSSIASATAAAANVTAEAKRLIDAGAVNVLIANVPGISANPASPIDIAAATFRTQLAMDLAALQAQYALKNMTTNIIPLDLYALYANIMASPASFGFTNVIDKANTVSNSGAYPANADSYLNWDGVNPTTAGHHQIAIAACTALTGTRTTLTVDSTVPTLAKPATLTATVSTAGTYGPQSTHTPTGTVTFYYPHTVLTTTSMVPLGTATLNASGQATITTAALTPDVYAIYAVYSGDTNFPTGCNSNTQTLTIAVATQSFDFDFSPIASYLGMEESANLTLTPKAIGGFTGAITFTCGSLPQFFSCSFYNNQTVQVVGGGTTYVSQLLINTKIAQKASLDQPPRPGSNTLGLTFAALLACPLVLLFGRRNRLATLQKISLLTLAFALSIGLTSTTGCAGAGGSKSTTKTDPNPGFGVTHGPGITYAIPGTYFVDITGTSGTLSVTHRYYIYIADTYTIGVTP